MTMRKFVFLATIVFLLITVNVTVFSYQETTQNFDEFFTQDFEVVDSNRLTGEHKILIPMNRLTTSDTTHKIEYLHTIDHDETLHPNGEVTLTLNTGETIQDDDLFTVKIDALETTEDGVIYHSTLKMNPMTEHNKALILSITNVHYSMTP